MLMRYRWICFGLFMAAVAAGLPFVPKALAPDNALDVWFVEDDPALAAYRQFHTQFGNDEVVLLGYHRAAGLINREAMQRLDRLTTRLERIDGVRRVYSVTNARDVVPDGFLVRIARPVAEHLEAPERIRRLLQSSPLITGRLLDSTGTTALVWIQMEVMDDIDRQRDRILAEIDEAAAAVLGEGEAHLAGTGVIYAGLNQITQHDFGLFMGLCYAAMFLLMYGLFRRAALVGLAFGVMLTATLLTLGIMGAAGAQVNMVTVILPTVITVLGLADIIHVLNQYAGRARAGTPRAALTVETLRRVFRPALFTSLTTAAGFLSLTASEVAALRELGLFAAVGIGLAFLATFCLSAALLPLVDPENIRPASAGHAERRLRRLARVVWAHPGRFAALSGGLVVLAAIGCTRLTADTYTLGYLPGDHRVAADHAFFEQHWGPYATVEMTVRPLGGGDLRDPELLQAMAAFSREAAGLEHIRSVFGLHALLERYSHVRYGNDRLLRSREQVRDAVRVLEATAGEDLRTLVSPDYALGRLTLTGEMMSAAALGRELDRITAIADAHFAGRAEVRFAGYPPLYVKIVDYVVSAQVRSFYLALALIFGLLVLFLRDLKLALAALVPNLFPVVLLLGLMGWLGITLDVATATVTAIVLGVAVDDTIHLLHHFSQHRRRSEGRTALEEAFAGAGRSVVFTSLLLAAGFAVLLFAGVKTVFYFGLLTTFAAGAALVGDLVLLPVLLRYLYPNKPALQAA